jgi:hypothetical protein
MDARRKMAGSKRLFTGNEVVAFIKGTERNRGEGLF